MNSQNLRDSLALRTLLNICFLISLLNLLTSCQNQNCFLSTITSSYKVKSHTQLPEKKLRGFGTLSGENTTYSNGITSFSVLTINCDSAKKAAIIQAKYCSDLQALKDVKSGTFKVVNNIITYYNAIDQGFIVCAREANQLAIISTQNKETLNQIFTSELLDHHSKLTFTSSAEVPMYLNSWDKYAFRFYYRPGELPKDKEKRKNYNFQSEFDYAKKNGDLGFVFWANENQLDYAEGLNQDLIWNWAARSAEKRQLPAVINTMTGPGSWMLNKYRDQTQMKMPQYCGSYHSIAGPYHAGKGIFSWCATDGKDAELALLQKIVKEYSAKENTIEYLEPHGELDHGAYNVFLEHGKLADENYRSFLKNKYKTPAMVSERWYGEADKINSWNDIIVPEVASFLGWNKNAIDLTGKWRINNFDGAYPADWVKADFKDDKWSEIQAPGHDKTMFLKKEPAVYRHAFTVSPNWLQKHPKSWLYVWDLTKGKHKKDKVTAYMNGKKAGESLTLHAVPHWAAFPVDKLLKAGKNQVSLVLPKGYLAYRVYISPDAPKQYPNLGKLRNAQWVDFTDWRSQTRLDMLKRGIEMIRQEDPDRAIICMAPDGYVAGIKELCEDYGARFHNTGHMGGFWNDYLPALMRSSDLPFSLEPGGPAKDLWGFKTQMAYYLTEGINAIHYFIHVGSIIWNDEIRTHFEKILPMLQALGKIHPPKAEIAFLHSDRIAKLTGYPWGKDPNTNLTSGYMSWRMTSGFMNEYRMDGVTDRDFVRGNADAYKLIYDSNTSVMDEKLVDDIKTWVEKGGTFVTFVQTGRHTPEAKDAWPISKLTGYKVTAISHYNDDGGTKDTWRLKYAPNQTVFNEKELPLKTGNGLKMQKIAPDAQNLILWDDGTVAAGMRKIGKGQIITLGVKFCNNRIWWGGTNYTYPMFGQIFKWAGCKPVPAKVSSKKIMLRQYVSNNGLFDVWALWNQDKKETVKTDLSFIRSKHPVFYTDVETGLNKGLNSNTISGITIPPMEVKMIQVPRNHIKTAALDWFKLQRNWWKGTKALDKQSLPELNTPNTLDLTQDWNYKELDKTILPKDTEYAAVTYDASAWPTRALSTWIYPKEFNTRHIVFRKEFTIPQNWKNGDINLWIRSWLSRTVNGRIRVWLDGKVIKKLHPPNNGIDDFKLNDLVKPGSKHVLTVEVDGQGVLPGILGSSFLSYIPNSDSKLNLKGQWLPTKDGLHYEKPVKLPGKWNAFMAKRNINIDAENAGKQVYLHMESSPQIIGVLINGHWLRRHHHRIGRITHLNITPWVEFGKENEIEIVSWKSQSRGDVKKVELYFY